MTTETLLVELGTEELPPKSLKALGLAFRDGIVAGLAERELDHGAVHWFATPRRLAVSPMTASPSSVAHLGRKEDDADPSLAPYESKGSTRTGVEDPVGGRELGERQLVATLPNVATPPPGTRRNHVENVGEHFVLATDVASINAWSPRGRYTPATVATVASSLSSVARSGHQEDDDYPVLARCRTTRLAASSAPNERSALAPKTVLGRSGEGCMASGFKPQVGMVAFRAGIG